MLLTKEILISGFDVNPENKTISIKMDTIIKDDEVELSRSSHRCAYVPGDILRVIKCLGEDAPEVAYLEILWTDLVIESYKEMIEKQE